MDTGKHQLEQLFAQLGLDNDVTAIKVFLARHWLEPGQALPDAAFWNPAQADFCVRRWPAMPNGPRRWMNWRCCSARNKR
jgi:hypothetical protein